MTTLECVLSFLFPHEDIGKAGSLYMRRWRVAGFHGRLPSIFGCNLMIHRIVRTDDDRDPHDHPWWFWSWVLKGGYDEEVWPPALIEYKSGESVIGSWREARLAGMRPAFVRREPGTAGETVTAGHTHRIVKLLNGDAWTLVVTGPREREWGFWTERGWVPHAQYFAAAPTNTKETTA